MWPKNLRNPVRYARKSQNLISGGTSHVISGLIHVGSGFSEPCWTLYRPLYSSQLLFLALTTTCLAPLWLRQNLPGFFSQLLLSLYSTWFKMKLVCGLFTISFFLFCISCDAKTTHKPKIIELCPSKVPKVNGTFKHELTTLRQAIEEVGSRSELR